MSDGPGAENQSLDSSNTSSSLWKKSLWQSFKEKHPSLAFWIDLLLNLVLIVGIVLLIRTFIVSPFQVFGPSMCDTFNYLDDKCQSGYGEYIIVNKFGYQNFFGWQVGLPQRGDVIVFHPPHNKEEYFIKRVIGLPGETVKLIDGEVYIYNKEHPNGFKLEEPYLNSKNRNNTQPTVYGDRKTVFEIPEGHYFALGDNRSQSSDARSCFKDGSSQGACGENGNNWYLTLQNIEGKAAIALWPLDKIHVIQTPTYE